MAEIFEKKTWVDRQSQYPTRRRLLPTSDADVYEIERAEGKVTETGDAYSSKNMNDLENRIAVAFKNVYSTDINLTNGKKLFTSNDVDGALNELFMYANSGKASIAAAIGADASAGSNFSTLAQVIRNGKLSISQALGNTALQGNTLQQLANEITAQKNNLNNIIAAKDNIINTKKYVFSGVVHMSNFEQYVNVNFGFNPSFVIGHGPHLSFGGLSMDICLMRKDKYDPGHGLWDSGIDQVSPTGCRLWIVNSGASIKASSVRIFAWG